MADKFDCGSHGRAAASFVSALATLLAAKGVVSYHELSMLCDKCAETMRKGSEASNVSDAVATIQGWGGAFRTLATSNAERTGADRERD